MINQSIDNIEPDINKNADLICEFEDNGHHEKHTYRLSIEYDFKGQFDPDVLLCLFAEEAEKKLKTLGNENHFKVGGIYYQNRGDKAITCMIDYVGGRYVFFDDKRIQCIERKTLYPLEGAGIEILYGQLHFKVDSSNPE